MIKKMSDLKTFDEVVEVSDTNKNVLIHNLTLLKKKNSNDPERLIAGVDFIKTKEGRKKYTPVGILKLTKGLN